jgi:hypothetical protein
MKGKISLDEVLKKFNEHNNKFINDLEKEESIERVDTLDSVINKMKADKVNTQLKKNKYISEIKSGLGEKIKEKPNDIKHIKKSKKQSIKDFLKKIFNKF